MFVRQRIALYTLQLILDLALEQWPPCFPDLDGSISGKLLREFNKNSDSIVTTYGGEDAGQMVWGLYGSGGLSNAAFFRSDKQDALATLRSVRELYTNGFEKHCKHRFGEEWPTKLDLACYMLWDMDGGLSTAALRKTYDMESTAVELLRFCLTNSNEAVQESALHALNHLYYDNPQVSTKLILDYLSLPGHSPSAIRYAKNCLRGISQ